MSYVRHAAPLAVAAALAHVPSAHGAQESKRNVVVRVSPEYPALAQRMHLAGEVTVRAKVEADGSVSSAHAESGHPLLRDAAEQAVKHWRFVSAAAPSECIVTVSFNAQDAQ